MDHLQDESMSHKAGIEGEAGMKLFVGQVPKNMEEDSLRNIFQEFGNVLYLSVIRDRVTKAHRGCAFVTYSTRDEAVSAISSLHDRVKLPNSVNFLQIRPAEFPSERENKVFVGMLNKSLNERDLEDMFGSYGELKEIHVVRDGNGYSKGCAFVKFIDRNAAIMAINELNETIPKGSMRPLVLKFADNKKTSKWKKGQDMDIDASTQHWMDQPGFSPSLHPMHAPQLMYSQHLAQSRGTGGMHPGAMPPVPHGVSYGQPRMMPVGSPGAASQQSGYYFFPGSSLPQSAYFNDGNIMGSEYFGSKGVGRQSRRKGPKSPDYGYGTHAAVSRGTGESDTYRTFGPAVSLDADPEENGARPPEGPPGANLFIYHLPRDLTDADLATLFAAFGNVISAKVFVDKKTAESKGFGFVSYDNVDCAEAAISAMNGFQIGSKRLKVQHKRTGHSPFDEAGEYLDSRESKFPVDTSYLRSDDAAMRSFLASQLHDYDEDDPSSK